MSNYKELQGHTFTDVSRDLVPSPNSWRHRGEGLIFTRQDGKRFAFYHEQDCCETVEIEDIVGDLSDLVGVPLLVAEEVTSYEGPQRIDNDSHESETWTFYKFSTIKGDVTVRWYGSSNGYYSESVDFSEI